MDTTGLLGRSVRLLALTATLALAGCGAAAEDSDSEGPVGQTSAALTSSTELALRWAPLHHQVVDSSRWREDYIARFNYDDDWVGTNNWENLAGSSHNPKPAAYYRVAETATHWFIGYAFMHPRDWDYGGLSGLDYGEHENDMEGVLEIVRKDGSPYGKFEGMMTIAHSGWNVYRHPTNAAYLTTGRAQNFDNDLMGTAKFEVSDGVERALTWAQAQGHGLYGCTQSPGCFPPPPPKFPVTASFVRYQPTLNDAAYPGNFVRPSMNVPYTLVDMEADDSLWGHRFNRETMAGWSNFAGDENGCGDSFDNYCEANAAGTPWGTALGGDDYNMFWIFADPAHAASEYFWGWDNADPNKAISLEYLTDNKLGAAHSWTGTWVPAEPAGTTSSAVGPAAFEDRIYLFTRELSTNKLKFSTYNGASWRAASDVPGSVTTDAATSAVECGGRLYVASKTVGSGGQAVRWISKSATNDPTSGWSGWANVPGVVSDTSVALACRGFPYLFFKGTDTRVYFTTLDTSTNQWSAARELPGLLTNMAPAAALNQSTWEMDVVVVGTDYRPSLNTLCGYCSELGGWSGWVQHPGWTQPGAPVALVGDDVNGTSSGMHMITRRLSGNRIEVDTWAGDRWNPSWRGPASVRGHQYAALSPAAVRFDNKVYLFAVGMVASYNIGTNQIFMTQSKPPGRLLSTNKSANQVSQISTYDSASASRAIDSRTDSPQNTFFSSHITGNWSSGFITHTNAANNPWWKINLGSKHRIDQIDVYNRTDCCAERLRQWSVYISDDDVNWTAIFTDSRPSGAGRLTTINTHSPNWGGPWAPETPGLNVPGPWTAQYVKIQINRNNEYLHLGEVQIWGE